MFGHYPRIPVNLVSGKVEDQDTVTKYDQIGHTKVYNRKVRGAVLEIGSSTPTDCWLEGMVADKPNEDIPVYEIKMEQGF